MLYHSRRNDRDRDYECDRGIRKIDPHMHRGLSCNGLVMELVEKSEFCIAWKMAILHLWTAKIMNWCSAVIVVRTGIFKHDSSFLFPNLPEVSWGKVNRLDKNRSCHCPP